MAAARYQATTVAESSAADPLVGTFPLSDTVAIAGVIFGIALLALAARTAVERQQALAANQKLTAELEERVRLRTAELESRNNDLATFSYSVSHDLRSPLRTITGFSEALLESHANGLNEEGQHYLKRINAATHRMDALLQGLLTLARVTQAPIQRERIDLSELARATMADLMAQERGRAVEIQIDDGLVAHGDAALVASVLQNLLGNAWKFTGRNPRARIHFGARRSGDETVFFVRDNGAGFEMASVQKLFGMFERLHGMAEFPGHGIGLAVTKRIVERHGGRISAESVKGESAEFSFTLPG
jgi:light-regulated signal transduction histidine kinase (bacteriophytochrome)